MSAADLARPEIRGLQAYKAGTMPDDAVRLNSNEAACALGGQPGLNRYPAARPAALTRRLASLYGVNDDNVLAVRGSSEGIDLLIRTFCAAGRDDILITPPVFELYQIYADVQGAGTVSVMLEPERNFELEIDAVLAACSDRVKLIFLCSPNNPVGSVVPRDEVLRVLDARAARSIVVVDEAYIEYSDHESLAPLVNRYDNLVVLRTLSKAHALAGARCGAVVAAPEVLRLLDGVLAPYAISSPVGADALEALSADRLAAARQLAARTIAERDRLHGELCRLPAVCRAWPSQANFVLVRFRALATVQDRLLAAGIVIRTFDGIGMLDNCARITIASPEDNDRLLDELRSLD